MKSFYGLGIAVALGIAGALFNFVYLSSKREDIKPVAFIGIKKDVTVARGDRLTDDHVEKIEIPLDYVGNLKDVADTFSTFQTIKGQPVWRTITGPRILLRDDYRPAPEEQLRLGDRETVRFVNVDTRSFVPALLSPGDEVNFLVPRGLSPTPAARPEASDADDGSGAGDASQPPRLKPAGSDDAIGPFKVLAVGNRLGTFEVWKTNRMTQMQENVLAIRISEKVTNERGLADELFRRLHAIDSRPVSIEIVKQGGMQAPTQ